MIGVQWPLLSSDRGCASGLPLSLLVGSGGGESSAVVVAAGIAAAEPVAVTAWLGVVTGAFVADVTGPETAEVACGAGGAGGELGRDVAAGWSLAPMVMVTGGP